ncbi:LOW QUALITY PROTEIN: Fc receptor-like protein 4 [Chamaea fasciata]|uniref:LOW QUALITY PROTEIN: Fc receptor-like protein 4 n=1 Tax=Chamaea fasciata TaxID=190680 RepID=UPI00336A4B78
MAGDTGMAGKVALLLWAHTLGLAGESSGDAMSRPAVPSPVVALAGWCPLSPAGAQTTQLLVEPPWRPAVLWDQVRLTCRGLGTTSATTWYKDGRRWGQNRWNRFTVSKSGTYKCQRHGSGLSPPVTVLNDQLVLQVSTQTLLEGDEVKLRCRVRQDTSVSRVRFYQDGKDLGEYFRGAELSLSPLQPNHSGRYHCADSVRFWPLSSSPVTVTVHELFTVPVLEGPPEPIEGSPLNLSCLSSPSPLRPRTRLLHLFYRDGQLVGGPQVSPQLLVPAVGVSDSGNYSCQVRSEGRAVQKSSALLRVTVRMPVANATITPGPLSHQVQTGDPVTLRCSVQVGSAPVNFTWLHNGQEVARGPVLELGNVSVGHSGTYQCVATNQLGQDGHRVFRALSPELALEVTPQGHRGTVAAGVGGSLLFLVLLVAVIVAWHWWHRRAIRKHQERASPEPPAPPEEGEVLYTHIVSTKQAQRPPRVTVPQERQVTYAELPRPHRQPREPSDICEIVP